MDASISLRNSLTIAALTCAAAFLPAPGRAQTAPPPTPPVIPVLATAPDRAGTVSTIQPGGPTATGTNAFFQALGTNGRSCLTCHDPQSGWTVNPPAIQARFQASQGTDPLFRPVDGATCPTTPASTPTTRLRAYALLTGYGLFRVALPIPANAQFTVAAVNDPYDCTTQPLTGLTSPTTGTLSVYRRPLPTTNLRFLTGVMWDGRETGLASQAIDATLIHAQADTAPTPVQQAQMTGFESGLFTAQSVDTTAGPLNALAATGGPESLAQQPFTFGNNNPANPAGFNRNVFTLYTAWQGLTGNDPATLARQSIARGERIFNTRPFDITGVAGLNSAALPSVRGTCTSCHNTPNVGNHSVGAMLDIGVTGAAPPVLDVAGLPVFTLTCTAGPLAGRSVTVTDPGRALVTGLCADIGKTKVPALRALASRAPYFHNGSAAGLGQVVGFYNRRFSMGLTPEERADLVNFLEAL